MSSVEELLTTSDLSKLIGISEGRLRAWRSLGLGPPWCRLNGSVRYRLEDVSSWIEARVIRPEREINHQSLGGL
ncbi:helix-turn-helix domain-containing protein [Nitrospinae bacterium AH_259_B05_G02_I21]|nr:helix-turn-helix domain-containing protein [Nitrospinae bacterium AH_259_B05_G02_I21]MDA2931837.1 helix-turn-helix domain-containing protein [Nitrospinae bacterium AH-259-F20]